LEEIKIEQGTKIKRQKVKDEIRVEEESNENLINDNNEIEKKIPVLKLRTFDGTFRKYLWDD
jgi:hypothetical protein